MIKTKVKAPPEKVQTGFTKELFLSLNPPFPPVSLIQFDGCKTGDRVALELNFLIFRQNWISDIVEDQETENEWYFVDKGVQLPFFLRRWEHRHIVQRDEAGSNIIDNIQFSTGTLVTDILLFPALYFQFLYRKPIYKKAFRKSGNSF